MALPLTIVTFNKHMQNTYKSAYYHVRAVRHIRSSLTLDMVKTIACILVNYHVDYTTFVLHGTLQLDVDKLQHVQNALARMATNMW